MSQSLPSRAALLLLALHAGLLLFRLLYYIVPFALSLAILGGRELHLFRRQPARAAANPPPSAPDVTTQKNDGI